MAIQCKRCETDEDFAKISLFLLEHKHDLHPSFRTMDVVSLVYSYMTEGNIVYVVDETGKVVGVSAYYHGTHEQEFRDKEVAFMDIAVSDRAHRGTRLFIKGLSFMVSQIKENLPEVREIRLAALSENEYICKLYAKFARPAYKREGAIGEETIFSTRLEELEAMITRLDKV